MSSLKAARADNYYFPPEHAHVGGSINKFQNSHPLGVRAKKIDQGILVIRYETPFHVKCEKCGHMIAKGVRFNAEKKHVGNFHSTKIWEFKMTCPSCKNKIVVKTNPEKAQYEYIEGAKQILNTENASEGNFIPNREDKERLADPLVQLENEVVDVKKAADYAPVIQSLIQMQDDKYKDDFEINLKMRRQFKDEKKIREKKEAEENKPKNFAIKLVTPSPSDMALAKSVKFKQLSQAKQNMLKSREQIRAQDIFLNPGKNQKNAQEPQKKQKISQSQSQYNEIQAKKAMEMQKLQMKLSKMPKSTQKLLKAQIKTNINNKNNFSKIQLNQNSQF